MSDNTWFFITRGYIWCIITFTFPHCSPSDKFRPPAGDIDVQQVLKYSQDHDSQTEDTDIYLATSEFVRSWHRSQAKQLGSLADYRIILHPLQIPLLATGRQRHRHLRGNGPNFSTFDVVGNKLRKSRRYVHAERELVYIPSSHQDCHE